MFSSEKEYIQNEIDAIQNGGFYKTERVLSGSQNAVIRVFGQKKVLNLCANNYLGLASHPAVIAAAKKSYDTWGYGLSSVRFICGTQEIHKTLEQKLTSFLGSQDTILYSSCFDANTGLFETLLSEKDAVISDELNHASIIDGIRLCKAERYRYKNSDMNDLEDKLKKAKNKRFRLIATDGVFSMDGYIAELKPICDLAEKYRAMVMIDDSHAVGFMGDTGRGTHEYHDVMDRVDIITGTLGKALGGASGGYTGARREIVELLRQRSRPYLFSNTVSPAIVSASIEVIDLLEKTPSLRQQLFENTVFFRDQMKELGFDILPGSHPIVPVMLGDAALAQQAADRLLEKGVYVIGFSYPVVPKGKARIRTQISAAHSREDLKFAVRMFGEVKKELNI
jgi:glycine C-acetyltransferase